MRTVVFDLDGTLADTSGDLLAAANACFRDMGAGDLLTLETDTGVALRGGRAMLRLGMERLGRAGDEATIDRYYPVLLEAYAEAIDVHTVLYPGAMAAVAQLSGDGYRVAVCTNKPEGLARILLERLGVLGAFQALTGADTLAVRKPDPEHLRETVRRAGGDPNRALMVGDTVTDHETARAAGVPSVLVGFGPGGAAVAALNPEAVIGHYDELPGVVRRLIG
ncbi:MULTISPECIES: HAD-IA family hydrolase [unclassified Roseovarius]|uniref:HAD-IA family hydrolase n=1 Tax=unclassified Roseovarius TaxID=2614913 RepID=UPI0000685A9B|nr:MULTISPECIES: HAD-IA family hydrolase [unclassified Roseovarius]EAQ27195.1 phosphoglycolate phosphatase [Roseovarius sp. 217]KJS43769.1 MAG: haloacid dehalogenase [Roseovarius sp. BRH_c41]